MCLLLLDLRKLPAGEITLLSNRDEFYQRPTQGLHDWGNGIMGGRDLKDGGTWLAVSRTGNFGVVTNFRRPNASKTNPKSRGLIVTDYLGSGLAPQEFLRELNAGDQYAPFSVILGNRHSAYYFSNMESRIIQLTPALYGLSNHLLDTEWFKVKRAKELYLNQMDSSAILSDRTQAPDSLLPDTGIAMNWEKTLSSIFIATETYGTRASTVLRIDQGKAEISEHTFGPNGKALDQICVQVPS